MTKVEDEELLCNCPFCNAIEHGVANENITCRVCGCKYHYSVNKTYVTTNTEEDYKNIIANMANKIETLNTYINTLVDDIGKLYLIITKLKSCNNCLHNIETRGVKNTHCKGFIKPTDLPGVYEYTHWCHKI